MTDLPQINRSIIAEYIADGSTCVGCGLIGLELEHIIVHATTHEAVCYSGEGGIRDILCALAPHFEDRTFEGDSLIGLACPDYTITIEPAGQLECSVAPRRKLSTVEGAYRDFRSLLDPILEGFGLEALACGYHPTAHARDLELIPKARYRYMDAHFARTGDHGICMMRGSASAQVSIDYTNEADAVRKFKIANLLGPLFAFICDNTPVFEGRYDTVRMARTRMWDDVDPQRSMVVPHLFSDGLDTHYTFTDYAGYIMSAPPILVMDGKRAIPTNNRTADDIYDSYPIEDPQVVHLLGMFFPDVRLKRYIEIRMADSMPIEYSLAYAALIKGLFYSHANLEAIEARIRQGRPEGMLDDDSIPGAKTALEQQGWTADVYGTPAYRWFDDLSAIALRGLPSEEHHYLTPLFRLIDQRTTLFDIGLHDKDSGSPQKLADEYLDIIESLDGDIGGRLAYNRAVAESSAIYHDQLIDFLYVPYLISDELRRRFTFVSQTMHSIMTKMIATYRSDPSYRTLFGFSNRLEQLIVLDPGYDQALPICRVDLFCDKSDPYSGADDLNCALCEVNTDGTSAMNEDRALSEAICSTPSFRVFSSRYGTAPQSVFDPLVRTVTRCYGQWREAKHPERPALPHVAIIDFTQSATIHEFEEFKKRFELNGMSCSICDVRSLSYSDGELCDTDGLRIDCIYRRAVTSELMEAYDDITPLLDALRDDTVAMVGHFQTHIPHCKRAFAIMRLPQTRAFLTEAEAAFIDRHVPYTALLAPDQVDLEGIIADKDAWIIKPDNGYASSGIFAGVECTQEEWEQALRDHCDGSYIVQRYCRQFSSVNLPARLRHSDRVDDDERAYISCNELLGLWTYDGHFYGNYTRTNTRGVIGATWGSRTAPSIFVSPKR